MLILTLRYFERLTWIENWELRIENWELRIENWDWHLLPDFPLLDWSLLCNVLYCHRGCKWVVHSEVRTVINNSQVFIILVFRYLSRFTEETFAACLGFIFIVESLRQINSKLNNDWKKYNYGLKIFLSYE